MQDKFYKDFPLFNQVSDYKLRNFNQLNMLHNIIGIRGEDVAKEYFNILSNKDRFGVMIVLKEIERIGFEAFRKELNFE